MILILSADTIFFYDPTFENNLEILKLKNCKLFLRFHAKKWATTRENIPSDNISVKYILFERRMFPKYYTFLFDPIIQIIMRLMMHCYMYPNDVIVMKK